jgi:hypothetical protein
MALFIWTDKRRQTMETTYEPAPSKDSGAKRPVQGPPLKEAAQHELSVRVSVLKDKHDDEEKEAGYGHGV